MNVAAVATVLPKSSTTGSGCAAHDEFSRIAFQHGIAVALLLTPEGETFRSWYSPAATLELEAFLNKLSADFGVPIYDAREWFDDTYFSDSHHLMPHGAREFTLRFEREILQPFIRGQVPSDNAHRFATAPVRP